MTMALLAAERLPWIPAIVLAGSLIPAGLLVSWLARRLARGDVGRNRLMGLRTNATMASDEGWRVGQATFARWGVLAGLGPVAAGALLLLRPPNTIGVPVVMGSLAWMVALVGVGAFLGDLAARDLGETDQTSGSSED